ncbi:MAG: carboxypeptidase-like regulatory domain-containing protein [Flavobacteriales bacterium]|nr:carboxypeptidase-like regulatory domain-containing protein [Flavobacteriales bacterium]
MKLIAIMCLVFSPLLLWAQTTQTIRGKVMDKESQYPLDGATVKLLEAPNTIVISGNDGKFRMENVPVGRHSIEIEYTFYKTRVIPLIVTAGKEIILAISMEDAFTEIEEGVEITAKKKGELNNDMASVSGKSFSVEETDRYAGSRSDPARMASNFAGVQGADDSRNDIVVRGNSPSGVLWRVEGIDIPNPNHFAISGTSGGPVSVLNNKTMANSDFFTAAFPAEYGNSTAGVFDLKLKNGNNEKHEFTGQFGFLGTEAMAEGPLSKNTGASYLFAYRYSTVSMFSLLGIDIGTSAVPKYQDLSFKFNFPLKNEANLSFFSISGKSDIDILISNQEDPSEVDLYGENDRDQLFGTRIAIIGSTYSKALNEKTFIKSTTAASIQNQRTNHILIFRHIDSTLSTPQFVVDSTRPLMKYWFTESKISNFTSVNKKFNKKNTLKFGLSSDYYLFDFNDSIDTNGDNNWETRWDQHSTAFMIRPFVQWKHNFSEKTTLNLGIHQTYFSQGNAYSYPEPRIGFNYRFKENQSLNFGAGLHSQIQPTYTYFYLNDSTNGSMKSSNDNLGLSRSAHFVLGYDRLLGSNASLRMETYYQYLFNIPVSRLYQNSLSMINAGGGFSRFFPESLENKGNGVNYGIEMTVERRFHKGYYFMLTGSLYNSSYIGSDGIERDTDFNGNFAVNGLFGWEKKLKDRNTIGIGTKITWAGGKRYGYIDSVASSFASEVLFKDEGYNSLQFRDYFRADLKLNYRINGKKKNITHEIAVDIVNLTGVENILSLTYAPDSNTGSPFVENYQLGRLPIFYYKIDF